LKEISSFEEKLLSEFKKIPNLSMQFYTQPSKACSCSISALSFRQIFELSKVGKVGSNETCSQNFSFLAALQISSKNRRQRRVTDGNSFLLATYGI
jgi:hypothetical protein